MHSQKWYDEKQVLRLILTAKGPYNVDTKDKEVPLIKEDEDKLFEFIGDYVTESFKMIKLARDKIRANMKTPYLSNIENHEARIFMMVFGIQLDQGKEKDILIKHCKWWPSLSEDNYSHHLLKISNVYERMMNYLTLEENEGVIEIRAFSNEIARATRKIPMSTGGFVMRDPDTSVAEDSQRFLIHLLLNPELLKEKKLVFNDCFKAGPKVYNGECWKRAVADLMTHELSHAARNTVDKRYFKGARAAALSSETFIKNLEGYLDENGYPSSDDENPLSYDGNPFYGNCEQSLYAEVDLEIWKDDVERDDTLTLIEIARAYLTNADSYS